MKEDFFKDKTENFRKEMEGGGLEIKSKHHRN